MLRLLNLSLAGLLLTATALPASAANIYCTVVGLKQGTFQGDPVARGQSQIAVYALTTEVKVPIDAATGQPTGRRQHSPIVIVKELDRSSPQFFNAAVTNELLRSVSCTLYHASINGGPRAYYKITLTNATIVEVKDSGDGVNGASQGDEHEHISFSYQKIELTDLDSGTTAEDDWSSPIA